ncbi:MAG TPA: hypothetical protein PKI93_00185 [Alphaproteobacteria bacterium]|nr:hypothetical protein [Alphaproteobacteria bacterium]HNS43978.1 hypothetical protein [Alphaproteobacteria bacterium]
MSTRNQNGNAFLYILIAVILFGALMFAISRSQDSDDSSTELDEGRVTVSANEILGYAASVTNAISQMQAAGAQNSDIDFIMPFEATFNDPPTISKLFHPDGGGLNYKTLPTNAIEDDSAGLDPSYYVGRFNSVEWTPSTTPDVLFVAYEITTPVCEALNLKLRNDATIPTVGGDTLDNLFIDDRLHAGSNADFEIANCADCEEIPALCVQNAAGKKLFYSVLEAE